MSDGTQRHLLLYGLSVTIEKMNSDNAQRFILYIYISCNLNEWSTT